jgi:hypothetical protein
VLAKQRFLHDFLDFLNGLAAEFSFRIDLMSRINDQQCTDLEKISFNFSFFSTVYFSGICFLRKLADFFGPGAEINLTLNYFEKLTIFRRFGQ